ncbi:transglycosylase SLT domain-containing protein [Litorivicinus lipolyticus]|uniref:Transglycosylase SLT domain-containing protein n=1 Tax=Litorivicinus lipolyticus TaxID=418701 RepID=A0A5Q2QF95_9GAMM|nr:transglycosylase SLT domain-containing protein [Litorivicinus lipolyticus]QGG80706.1 transglycosylase SLT domain-containing protein [Litorivicinus lipolyticus]
MRRALWIVWALSLLNAGAAEPGVDQELLGKLRSAVESAQSFDDDYDATVWLTLMGQRMARYNPDPDERLAILIAVHREARRVDIPPEMVLSVMHVESRFKRFAISRVGAQGLMQIMPFWKNEINHSDANLFDVDTNIRFGCTILKHYLDRERGNWARALARYNGSLGKTWYPEKVMSAWDRVWFPG